MTLNYRDVCKACTPVTAQWKELGTNLGVEKSILDIIQADNPHSTRQCLLEMIDKWLKHNCADLVPTWRSLCDAIFHVDQALAEKISEEHGCNYISPAVSHSSSRSGVPPAFLPQSCGCGECTIKKWMTGKQCQMGYSDERPALLLVSPEHPLTTEIVEFQSSYERQAKLCSETSKIVNLFTSTSSQMWTCLEEAINGQKFSLSSLVLRLNSLLKHPLPLLSNLHELQIHLHSLRVSWFSFHPLYYMSKEVLFPMYPQLVDTWNAYLTSFQHYCSHRQLKGFTNIFFQVEKENIFLLEVDESFYNFTLSDIHDLRKSLSLALDVPFVSLHLVTIRGGSIIIYFYYCYSDYLVIFKNLTSQQLQKISQIKAYRILSLTDLNSRFTYDNIQSCEDDQEEEKEVFFGQNSTASPGCESSELVSDPQLLIKRLKREKEIYKQQSLMKSQDIEKLKNQLVTHDQKEIESELKSVQIEAAPSSLIFIEKLMLSSENSKLKILLEKKQAQVMKLKEKDDIFQLWKKVNTPSVMTEDEAILKMKTTLVKDLCNAIQIESISAEHRLNGIAVCDNGDILSTQQDTHSITVWDKEGMQARSIGRKGTKEGEFMYPTGLAITNDQHILVTDHHRLQKLTLDGVCVKSLGSDKSGSSQLQFNVPGGIAVHPTSGQIFITEFHRIQVLNDDLSFSGIITLQDNVKQFKKPQDISLDSDGYLYVAEYDNHCITKLTPTGQYITRFDCQHGSAPGQLSHPSSLAISNNLVYVCEWGNHRVSVFDTQGRFLHCFGKYGSENREFIHPRSVAIDKQCNLYVNDRGNKRIIVHYMLH